MTRPKRANSHNRVPRLVGADSVRFDPVGRTGAAHPRSASRRIRRDEAETYGEPVLGRFDQRLVRQMSPSRSLGGPNALCGRVRQCGSSVERLARGHQVASIRLTRRRNPAQCSSHVHLADDRARDEVGRSCAARGGPPRAGRGGRRAAGRRAASCRAPGRLTPHIGPPHVGPPHVGPPHVGPPHAGAAGPPRAGPPHVGAAGRPAASHREAGPTAPATGLKVRPMGW